MFEYVKHMFEYVTTAGHDFLPRKYPHDRTQESSGETHLLFTIFFLHAKFKLLSQAIPNFP